jgi:hypothetical protein
MGRIVDLCGDVAAAADEGRDGLMLPPEAWDRLRAEWPEEDIEDALGFVRDSVMQGELVEVADSLSTRLLELLGRFGEGAAFESAAAGDARLSMDEIRQLAHRVALLEEVLDYFRDRTSPERGDFDRLQRRLLDQGIENEMEASEESEG